ncbi:AAA family ATPase [candidate division KSB1 bacterium]|nr:AAA family ATPase [candidate division KSB1 bacterium]
MKYLSFEIRNYRGITEPLKIDIKDNSLIPLIGINECGKTTILQAIFCFDEANDTGYKGKHLKDTLNLYKTDDEKNPTIIADVEIKYRELEQIVHEYNIRIEAKKEGSGQRTDELKEELLFATKRKDYKNAVRIQRDLLTKQYKFADKEFDYLNPIAKNIVRKLPYVLYNDDFVERPPNSVKIPLHHPDKLDEWLSIYERLFTITNSKYSLFKFVEEPDERRRSSIISDVEEELNKRLTKAWKTFLLDKQDTISVKLKIDHYDDPDFPNVLETKIIEKLGKKDRYFDVVDRSKGFLWFFNFVMKLEFNPKIIGKTKDTVYLLDEPGSYLHSSAQEKLCNKIKEISDRSGNVIYCTHSHHLLNPEFIPLNKIYIVEKEKNKNIKAAPLSIVKPKKENLSAFQPLLDALQIPAFDFYNNDNPIIAVEGIYDKYVIKMFVDLDFDYTILPGTSANSIVKNIQFLNGFLKNYIAIWDNDDEGRKEYNRALKLFGQKEGERFDKLPLLSKKTRKMEQMFENDDWEKIRAKLGLPPEADYEKIISILYFSNKSKLNELKLNLSNSTIRNFSTLGKIIEKRFVKSRKIREFEI